MGVNPCGKCYLLVFSFIICVILTPCVFVWGYEQNCKFNLKRDGTSEFYDLTSLSQPWKMKIGNDSQQNAIISLCGAAKTPCGRDGVCIAEKKGDSVTYRNMGNILQRPNNDLKSKRLTIRLTDGDQCTSSMNYSTEINFYCTEKFGEPLFQMFRNHTCQLVVDWGTKAACTLESAELQESCKPTGFSSFNLWPLHHKQYYTVKADKREYRINICGKVLDGVCNKTDDGSVCEMIPETNKIKAVLGLSTKQRFEYSERGLILTYKSKDKKMRTEIHFICNTSIPHGQPTLKLTNSSTVIVFEVETALACVTRPVDCIAYDSQGSRYDLQALSNNRRNWEVSDNRKGYENVKYYINVCRPLNPTTDYNCSVIQIYAPTTEAEEEDIDQFYEDLRELLQLTPKKDIILIIGDWNAKVGNQTADGVIGKFGLGITNEAGQRLLEFCQDNSLVITNILCQLPNDVYTPGPRLMVNVGIHLTTYFVCLKW
ncbi:cation-independent mannose-6-phosphate receptor [Anabrus simplex]|uniref:cation-independent mannose-6-phosphate receptor n=1 Tax=Anabrus simplex TaxID=316456 RepID=UPI0035A37705